MSMLDPHAHLGPRTHRPEWFDDWVDFISRRIRGFIASGLPMPPQRRLEGLWGEFVAERERK
jgi:hypothetical protein